MPYNDSFHGYYYILKMIRFIILSFLSRIPVSRHVISILARHYLFDVARNHNFDLKTIKRTCGNKILHYPTDNIIILLFSMKYQNKIPDTFAEF